MGNFFQSSLLALTHGRAKCAARSFSEAALYSVSRAACIVVVVDHSLSNSCTSHMSGVRCENFWAALLPYGVMSVLSLSTVSCMEPTPVHCTRRSVAENLLATLLHLAERPVRPSLLLLTTPSNTHASHTCEWALKNLEGAVLWKDTHAAFALTKRTCLSQDYASQPHNYQEEMNLASARLKENEMLSQSNPR